jgi:hypothetical protein
MWSFQFFPKIRGDISNILFIAITVSLTPAISWSPMSLTTAINYRRCDCYWRKIIAGVVDTGVQALSRIFIDFMKPAIINRL